MTPASQTRATLDDLMRAEGKAELIGGRIVRFMATGRKPNRVAGRIFRSLDDHAEATGRGEAYTDNMGFAVPELPSGRESFSPDASYYVGPLPANPMRFIDGPPDPRRRGPQRGRLRPGRRACHGRQAGRLLRGGDRRRLGRRHRGRAIHVYRAGRPGPHATYARGQVAEAEPAVPGWRPEVDAFFQETRRR